MLSHALVLFKQRYLGKFKILNMALSTILIPFSTWLLGKISDKGFDVISDKLISSDKINIKFNTAIENVSKELGSKYPEILGHSIVTFFKKEIILNELVKLIFTFSKIDVTVISNSFDVDTLPLNFIEEFIEKLKIELLKDRDFEEIFVNKELFILIQSLDNNIEQIEKNSNLAKSEIITLRTLLEQRLGPLFSINHFIFNYTESAIRNLSQINFIGLGLDISVKRERKNIGDVFVKPNFKLGNKKIINKKSILNSYENIDNDIISYNDLFNYSDKIIILGNPGSGKSILVKSIICNILEKNDQFTNKDILNALPFRIELRKYLSFKKQHRGNILKYLNSLIEEEYGINNITESILDKILLENISITFFDGLDEIFKIQDKIEIRNDIENFHTSYRNAKSLTTSRIIGYEEAKLNPEEFCELNILNFDKNQIEEYLNKWYDKEEPDVIIRDRETKDFLEKKGAIDDELISNPLLLSLIVILYRNVLKLPESKLEIYQSCTKTLVDKWDSIKGLEIDLDPNIYKNKEKIFAELAYWQYEQLSGDEVNITYDKALKTVSNTLENKLKLTDEFNSDDQAQNFMEYAQKRSIYFDNNFTHKTFLEYYTAYWIFSNIEKKNKTEDRNEIISTYISNPFWHIVIELLLNMIDNDQADNEIIDGIVYGFSLKSEAVPFALTSMYSLKNISIDSNIIIINKAIEIIIENYSIVENDHARDNLQSKIFDALSYLFNNIEKSRNLICNRLFEISQKKGCTTSSSIILSFYFELEFFGYKNHLDLELLEVENLKEEINKNEYLYIMNTFCINNSKEEVSFFPVIETFVTNFGIESLFKQYSAVFRTFSLSGFFYFYLFNQLEEKNLNTISKNLNWLINQGLNLNQVFNYIFDRDRIINKFSAKQTKVLLEKHEIETNSSVSKIILLLIFTTMNNNDGIGEIKSFAKKSRNKTTLNKLLSLDQKQRLEFIDK
jgi:hypothetical protein